MRPTISSDWVRKLAMTIKLFVTILLTVCFFGCNSHTDEKIILSIGKYKLSKNELESKRKSARYKSLTDLAFEDKLIEEGLILAFTLDHQYDTISTLNKLMEYSSRSYASQMDGFVWNRKVKQKLQLTEKDVRDAYQKRSKEYTIEVIVTRDKSILNNYKSVNALKLIKAKGSSNGIVKVFRDTVKFPYYPLSKYIEGLNGLKDGDVVGPAETENGYVIARVVATKQVVQNSYEKEKVNIRRDLLFGLTQKYLWKNQQQILKKADPKIYDDAIMELTQKFDPNKKDWAGVSPNLLLMSYVFGGKRISYQVSDFREFVANEPVFFGSLDKVEDVKKMFRSFIVAQYLFAEAKQMDMKSDEEFLQFAKDNWEKIYLEHFKRNYIYPKLSIKSDELEEYYHQHTDNFRAFESAIVQLYKFKDIQKAFQARTLLANEIKGATFFGGKLNTEVKLADQNNDPELIMAIIKLSPGQISSPIKIKGEYVVMVLSAKNGSAIIPYIYVKGEVQQLVYVQKSNQLTVQLTKELKAKYQIETNDIRKHLVKMQNNQPSQQ